MIYAFTWLILLYATFGLGSMPFTRPLFPLWFLLMALLVPPVFFFVIVYAMLFAPPPPTVVFVEENELVTPPARILLTPRHGRRFR